MYTGSTGRPTYTGSTGGPTYTGSTGGPTYTGVGAVAVLPGILVVHSCILVGLLPLCNEP